MSNYFVHAENDYRRETLTRSAAEASRSGRSRSSWVRRLAASDPTLRRSAR